MREGDPLPMDVERIFPSTFVGEVGALFTTFFFVIPAPVVGAAQSAAHLLFG